MSRFGQFRVLRRGAPAERSTGGRSGSLRVVVHGVVAVLVVLLVCSAAATGVARATVAGAQAMLSGLVLPSRQATSDLASAYLDQETGARGFLLTGDPVFLEPYERGTVDVDRLFVQLADLLTDDAEALVLLDAVRMSGDRWRSTIAEPEIAARRLGPLAPPDLESVTIEGKRQFDVLRTHLDRLEEHTAELTTVQLARIRQAQSLANGIAITAAALAVLVAVGTWLFLRRRLSRPLDQLLSDVQTVADGNYDHHIGRSGPREFTLIADSVNRMRESVVESGRARVTAQHELTLRNEHDRMAADLHDLTIQRVFGLGLRLAATARRHPELAAVTTPLVAETDQIIRELRTVIFDLSRGGSAPNETLRARVIDLVEHIVPALGFTPSLQFSGPIDTMVNDETAEDLLAALREALSNVARHAGATQADVCLEANGQSLTLAVRDDGIGLDAGAPHGNGLANIQTRATRLGGEATVRPGTDGTGCVVDWRVPVIPQDV